MEPIDCFNRKSAGDTRTLIVRMADPDRGVVIIRIGLDGISYLGFLVSELTQVGR